MKNVKIFFLAFGFALAFAACTGGSNTAEAPAKNAPEATTTEAPAETDQSRPEYTSAYVCPMHCEGSGSAEMGKCPKCEMDYVKNEEH